MQIKASTALRNEYPKISELAHASGEPVFITNKGEADLVVLSIEAFEEREKLLTGSRISICARSVLYPPKKPSMRSWSISGYLVSILMPDRFTQIRCWPNRNTANWC